MFQKSWFTSSVVFILGGSPKILDEIRFLRCLFTKKGLYSKPFAWRKSYTCIQTFKNLETTLKKASHSISLIAGVYGDDDGE